LEKSRFQQLTQIQPRNLTWGIYLLTLWLARKYENKINVHNNGVPGSKVLDNIRLIAKGSFKVMENNSTFNMTCLIPM
jgi:hypothetical protein